MVGGSLSITRLSQSQSHLFLLSLMNRYGEEDRGAEHARAARAVSEEDATPQVSKEGEEEVVAESS